MRKLYRIVPGLAVLLLGLTLAPPAGAAAAEPRIDRIAQVGRLWSFVRYLHPYPHVEIAPTHAGLHAGKDEVLDRALEDLQQTPAREAGTQETPTP